MKRIIQNVLLLNMMAIPCLAMFNDINPVTGDWNYSINLFGIVYSLWFYHSVLKKVFKI